MATYAIGDVQGCLTPLLALLDKLGFDPARDQLWFTGDLVNRGPQSADVLRFVKGLGEGAVTVLGNHDLHLLAVAGGHAPRKRGDTVEDILSAPDRGELLHWLRCRPLVHHDATLGFLLVHAGLLPQWGLGEARALAAEAEQVLQSDDSPMFFEQMYGDLPDHWHGSLTGWDRLRVAVNAFTRLRYCDAEGRMDLRFNGPPGTQPAGLLPWFEVPGRKSRSLGIVFGHWSTLGTVVRNGAVALDSGCVWGGSLTATRLDNASRAWISVPCDQQARPSA